MSSSPPFSQHPDSNYPHMTPKLLKVARLADPGAIVFVRRRLEKTARGRLAGKAFLRLARFAEAEDSAGKALGRLPPDHPFHGEVHGELQECKRCLGVQRDEKLKPVLDGIGPEGIHGRLVWRRFLGSRRK